MADLASARVLEFRYSLYSQAYDALAERCGANELLRLHALALGCKRAAEGVELAEHQLDAGFPKLAPQHLAARRGGCADCVRAACLAPEEIERVWAGTAAGPGRERRREGSAA
jgi:hypothetical protein